MNAIDAVFATLRPAGKKAFIPFITAGDPNLLGTELILRELVSAGADIIEVGFPYSDPIADGPVIQASYHRALEKGLRISEIFETAKNWKANACATTPLVGMVSFSLVHRRRADEFIGQAADAGFSGVIIPDLPIEEAMETSRIAEHHEIKLIQLVTPTTSRERAARILKHSSGFVYCVSVTGITGERTALPESLRDHMQQLRSLSELPLCVGFGVSRPEQVEMIREIADGVIVGSAIVRFLENAVDASIEEVAQNIGRFVRELRKPLVP